jgi:23S rRNA (guanosine2251-2'-O)-methyltransferase
LVLDGIEEPRNLGALIRTADACGVEGVIIPKDRASGITPAAAKASAEAAFHLPVVRVGNIASTLKKYKNRASGYLALLPRHKRISLIKTRGFTWRG